MLKFDIKYPPYVNLKGVFIWENTLAQMVFAAKPALI